MLDKGNSNCSVFLDFAKAFDTVELGILLSKLQNYGKCIKKIAKDWFQSYLPNCKQVLKKGNIKFIACGLPQGTILGPILFLLYINDIKHSSDIFKIFLFPDATNTLLINKKV